ncbi:hypothetical protein GDO78_009442 [Eleutherodactylus coqui]|uniref:Uncharacterized protein n=1 Tax=Eleutherodactylus coqui TaxID=57060 RepID=A0A8J6FA38_ELECQ|nr:hypothetical protein GDO78_009442 [Eleutherodactylus coqui]
MKHLDNPQLEKPRVVHNCIITSNIHVNFGNFVVNFTNGALYKDVLTVIDDYFRQDPSSISFSRIPVYASCLSLSHVSSYLILCYGWCQILHCKTKYCNFLFGVVF